MFSKFTLMLRATLIAASLACASVASAQTQSIQQPTAHSLDADDVNTWADGYLPFALRSSDIAGAVFVVVKDGQVLTARGYGYADIASHRVVDPTTTLFRVGSVSKLFTWTAVMQQVEAGRLDLDHDVNTYIDFRIPPFQGQPVTLRQIMTHTAGFELAGKDTITFNAPIALDTYLKRWIPTRIYAPGTTPAYSNWGAALAGYIVQRASGEPFDDYIEHHIFNPLGMRASSFRQPLPPNLAPFVASGYPRASGPPQGFEVVGPTPAGALSATGADMARFMIAHLEHGRGLLTPATADLMHASPLNRVNPRSLIPPLNRAELGFMENNINGHEVLGHLGDTQNFHTLLALFMNDNVGLFVSFNSAGRDGAVRNEIFHDFADRYFPAPPAPPSAIDPATARRHAELMTGMWQASSHAATSFLAIATLAGQTAVTLNKDGSLLIPSVKDASGGVARWDEIAPFVWASRAGHERIAAQVVNGAVVRWGFDSAAPAFVLDRVPPLRSAQWLMPLLLASLAVLALTALYWPIAWYVRRRYKTPIALSGQALHAYRAVHVAAILDLGVLIGWVALVATMLSNISLLSARSDGALWFLQIAGAIVFVGAVGVAAWNAVLTWRDKRHLSRKFWSFAILIATLTVLYVAATFGLLAMSVNY